ncbi:MAG: low temperature requirement protein A [Streptosporangiaceae bacterium]|nr:low temperature requirement protein A [Streptosporangiaceae bacterium]
MTADADPPVRVSTLELFFDLVFVFTITQLTGMLAGVLTPRGALQAVLVFGVLWWMYGGYAWLTNTRTPAATPERLLLLLGMAGFLVIGMAVPHAFTSRREGIVLGLGYLFVVAVHGALYLRVNRNILRVTPFNVASALLVTAAGAAGGATAAGYALWLSALAVQALSPLISHPRGRFSIQPSHFTERHGALIIVAFGESVADIGIGAAGRPVTGALVATALLGLALAAALWWAYFGVGDDERAEEQLTRAGPAARPALALNAYFYSYIPMLLGIVTLAAGVKLAIGHRASAAACLALGGGVALYLAGDAAFRRALRIGTQRYRAGAAAAALAATAVGIAAGVTAQLALLTVIVAAALAAERHGADSVET